MCPQSLLLCSGSEAVPPFVPAVEAGLLNFHCFLLLVLLTCRPVSIFAVNLGCVGMTYHPLDFLSFDLRFESGVWKR